MGEGDHGNRTYADYLQLHELLELQSEERSINSDEMHSSSYTRPSNCGSSR